MSTITKEWLQKAISQHEAMRDEIPFGLDEDDSNTLAAMRIALASLEAEAVHQVLTGDAWVDLSKGAMESQKRVGAIVRTVYTAPPAPVLPRDLEEIIFSIVNAMADEKLRGDESELFSLAKKYIEHAKSKLGAAMLQSFGNSEQLEPVTTAYKLPEETGSSLQLRNLIRQRHAEWSQSTFGDVGPVGPLKHLSKEALEAAAEPDDLSEWADMQFLLWDAQRRAGICDGELTAAMEEKLRVNMARQWPEPKDGEPRLHIKEDGNSPVIPDGLRLALSNAGIAAPESDEMLAATCEKYIQELITWVKERKPFRSAVIPDGWVACSERMPKREVDVQVYCAEKKEQMVAYLERNEGEGLFRFATWRTGDGIYCQPTHWMPLPAAPQQEVK